MPAAAELKEWIAEVNAKLAGLRTDVNQINGRMATMATELERQAALAGLTYQRLEELEDYVRDPVTNPDPDPPPDPEPEEPETLTDYHDFTDQSAGDMFNTSLIGRGRDLQRYVITGSTKAGSVPTTGVNVFQGQRAGSLTKANEVNALTLQGYTMDMSDVNHNANGMQLAYVKNPTARDLRVIGARGSASSPPGETASLSLWHCGEGGGVCILDDIELFGWLRDDEDELVAASLLMLNDTYNVTCDGLKANGAKWGFGIAVWQCGGINVFNQPDFRGCRKAINHEQPRSDGLWTYNEPDCRELTRPTGGGQGAHAVFNGNLVHAAGHYPRLRINNPLWDDHLGPFRVGVIQPGAGTYLGKTQTSRAIDVEVLIDGTLHTGVTNNSDCIIGQAW